MQSISSHSTLTWRLDLGLKNFNPFPCQHKKTECAGDSCVTQIDFTKTDPNCGFITFSEVEICEKVHRIVYVV